MTGRAANRSKSTGDAGARRVAETAPAPCAGTGMATIRCVGCGAGFPDVAGPMHGYMESCPGCWAAYGEVLAREYGDRSYGRSHRLTVDAYAVQHPGRPSRQAAQSVAVHLLSLCLVLERGLPADKATRALGRAVKVGTPFPWLEPPPSHGLVTVADVRGAPSAGAHVGMVAQWACSAWMAWAHQHGKVRFWLRSLAL